MDAMGMYWKPAKRFFPQHESMILSYSSRLHIFKRHPPAGLKHFAPQTKNSTFFDLNQSSSPLNPFFWGGNLFVSRFPRWFRRFHPLGFVAIRSCQGAPNIWQPNQKRPPTWPDFLLVVFFFC